MTTGRPISQDDLHAYVDRLLDTSRHAEVEAYLERHPDVAQRVRGFASQRDMLRAALGPIAQEPVPPELSLSRLVEARLPRRGAGWRWAAAACLLVALGGAGGWFGRGMSMMPSTGMAALAEEASDSYEVFGPDRGRPVEIKAADSADLVKWVSNRLQRPISVPDLTAAGYRFMGGRLVPTPHGPAGMFMYDNDHGARLVMLVRPMSVDKEAPMTPHSRGSVAGLTWVSQGVGYSIVGGTSSQALHPLADEARRQIESDA